MTPNSAPFIVQFVSVCYIDTCNPQHPVANVIVDGSSPFTRFMTTADSKCQPLFILRTGRELGRLGWFPGCSSCCQFLTVEACKRLTFGTISGPGVVFLAPNSALGTMATFAQYNGQLHHVLCPAVGSCCWPMTSTA
jgi:hypothetical protein